MSDMVKVGNAIGSVLGMEIDNGSQNDVVRQPPGSLGGKSACGEDADRLRRLEMVVDKITSANPRNLWTFPESNFPPKSKWCRQFQRQWR
eukprot:10337510-Karenia_brevis.AAC.1